LGPRIFLTRTGIHFARKHSRLISLQAGLTTHDRNKGIMTMSFKRTYVAAAAALVMTGASAQATEAQYDCSGGTRLTAHFSPPSAAKGQVVLAFDGSDQKLTLPQVMSADGGRYANDSVEFWIKGRNATLTRDGKKETCSTK